MAEAYAVYYYRAVSASALRFRSRRRMEERAVSNPYGIKGIQCLEHSNWTICNALNPSSSDNFQFVSSLYWEANSYYPRGLVGRKGKSANFRNGCYRGILVPGAFKLDHMQPFKPILFWQFSICLIFILGGQFSLPQRANSENREFFQFQN